MASCVWGILIFWQLACLVQGGVIVNVQMVSYKNSGGKDWKNNRCDFLRAACDHKFTFCFDQSSGNSDPEDCLYRKETTGEFRNENEITFDQDMASVRNPVELTLPSWPGAIRFKVKITDDDGVTRDDLVDTMDERWSYTPARSANLANWHRRHIRGTRTSATATSLVLKVRVYCHVNYYTTRCDKYCKAIDGPRQHYTCDPDKGDEVCLAGWEGNSCDIRSDDCIDNKCTNGATCVDRFRRYTCKCLEGFTGEYCETDIDDCAASTCKNGGTCVDQVGGYKCTCQPEFVGTNCSLSVCHDSVSPCQNGGTCYVHQGIPKCICPPALTGDQCTRDKCLEISCENQGRCEKGLCVCRPGYLGHLCGVNICQTMQCLNGATCQDGVCHCMPGYTGRLCQTPMNACESDPCQHKGACRSHNDGGYHCRCLPAYNGAHCEHLSVSPHVIMTTSDNVNGWLRSSMTTEASATAVKDTDVPVTSTIDVDGFLHYTTTASAAAANDTDIPVISTRKSLPGWVIGLIVALLVLFAIVVAFFVMRRRLKNTGGEETVTSISNPDYEDILEAPNNGIYNDRQGATTPPYTGLRTFAANTPPFIEAEMQNRPNAHFVYDHPPPPRRVAAVAAEAEAPELPIKAALRLGQELV